MNVKYIYGILMLLIDGYVGCVGVVGGGWGGLGGGGGNGDISSLTINLIEKPNVVFNNKTGTEVVFFCI